MERRCVLWVALCAPLFFLGSERSARAVLLTDWTVGATTVDDVLGDVGVGAHDILKLWHKQDGGFHYFRMDLQLPPVQAAGLFSPEYSIQIDSEPGGGAAVNTSYIASNLIDIDSIIASHFTLATGFAATHLHNYDPLLPAPKVDTTNLVTLGGLFDSSENGGATLQWAIPVVELGAGPFTFYGATHSVDSGVTYDVTPGLSAAPVPEPMSIGLALITCGLGAVVLRRRMR